MDIDQIVNRFSGKDYLDFYDKHRPTAPYAIVDSALQYARMKFADKIVDIGCGTGLSTFIWKDKAASIVGIDPSDDMRRLAMTHRDSSSRHVQFVHGTGQDVPIETGSADIVSCGQVFHWMDTEKTLSEVNRILRPGGVFIVFDCQWPPSFDPNLERAYHDFFVNIDNIAKGYNSEIVIGHMKQEHRRRIAGSGYFNFTRESHFHKTEPGTSERFEGILMSQGGVHALLRNGFSEEDIGLEDFRRIVRSVTHVPNQMTFRFKTIFAIKRA